MKPAIRIENLKPSKFAICQADVAIVMESPGQPDTPLVTIKECTLRDGEKSQWLGLPSRKWEKQDGTVSYVRHVWLPDHTYNAALAALQAAWQQYCSQVPAGGPVDGAEDDPFEGQ